MSHPSSRPPSVLPAKSPSSSSSAYRAEPFDIATMPPGIPYIIGNEAAERFSFYGMKAILFVFMTQHLLGTSGEVAVMDDVEAKEWLHTFVAGVYFLSIVGAILCDWLLGKYRTILWLSLVYCLGHATMALVDFPTLTQLAPRTCLWWALALIAVGSGGIKPCVSAHVGDQFGTRNKHLVTQVFLWFYFSINVGATSSTLLIPVILDDYGPGVAFALPGILMGIATFLFWLGRHQFVHVPPTGSKLFADLFRPDGRRALLNLIPLYVLIAMFWSLFDQTASSWVQQATLMDRTFWGKEMSPAQIQAANPVLVMVLIPLFSYVVYPAIGRFYNFTPLRRIGCGMFIMVLTFALSGQIQVWIDAGKTPPISWQLAAYLLLTIAELLISITALEFSYTQAPTSMKSFLMSLNLMSVALGNLITARVNHFIGEQRDYGHTVLDGANYYWFFTIAMLITAVLYLVWSRFYRGQTYLQGDSSATA